MTGNLKTGLTTGNLKAGLTTGSRQGPVVKPVFKKRQGEGNFYLSIVLTYLLTLTIQPQRQLVQKCMHIQLVIFMQQS